MIIPVKRLSLVAHKADEADILKALQRLNAVEVIPDGEATGQANALDEAEARVQRLSAAMAAVRPFAARSYRRTGTPLSRRYSFTCRISSSL